MATGPSRHRLAIRLAPGASVAAVAEAAARLLPACGVTAHAVEHIPRQAATQKVSRDELRAVLAASPLLAGREGDGDGATLGASAAPAGGFSGTDRGGATEALCAAVADALSLDAVPPATASFLELGGDSAAAVRAAALFARAASRRAGCDGFRRVGALELLRAARLADLGLADLGPAGAPPREEEAARPRGTPLRSWLGRLLGGGCGGGDVGEDGALQGQLAGQLRLPPRALEEVCPCTPLQEVLLTSLDAEAGGGGRGAGGLLQTAAWLPRGLDPARLRAAWLEAQRCHPALRTAFAAAGGRYWQVPPPRPKSQTTLID